MLMLLVPGLLAPIYPVKSGIIWTAYAAISRGKSLFAPTIQALKPAHEDWLLLRSSQSFAQICSWGFYAQNVQNSKLDIHYSIPSPSTGFLCQKSEVKCMMSNVGVFFLHCWNWFRDDYNMFLTIIFSYITLHKWIYAPHNTFDICHLTFDINSSTSQS